MPYLQHGINLHYSDNNAGGEAVILLHGLGSRGEDWQPQVAALSPQYRVITLDFPGHGESGALNKPISMQDLAQDVVALLDYLRIDSAHVIGLSLGGMVAFQLAVDYPKRLRSMVVINSAPGLGTQSNLKLKLRLLLRKGLLRAIPLNILAQRIGKDIFPDTDQESLRAQYLSSMEKVDKKSYQYIVSAIGKFNLDNAITGCQIPTLILAADNDYTSVSFKQTYVNRMSNARMCIIPNSRHGSPLDSPEFCNREILKFLGTIMS